MRAILTNKLTGARVVCNATTNHPSSSYGKAVWVDDNGNALQQVDLPEILQGNAYYTVEVIDDSKRKEEERKDKAEAKAKEQFDELIKVMQARQEELGLSNYRLSVNAGLTKSTIANIYNGISYPNILSFLQVLNQLGLSIKIEQQDNEEEE